MDLRVKKEQVINYVKEHKVQIACEVIWGVTLYRLGVNSGTSQAIDDICERFFLVGRETALGKVMDQARTEMTQKVSSCLVIPTAIPTSVELKK